jgi:cellulose synthase (UDP-forming)
VLLNLVGVAVGIWSPVRPGKRNPDRLGEYCLGVLQPDYPGGAVAVSVESKQVRRSHRVEMSMPAAIAREDGHLFSCTVHDYSDGGLGIKIHGEAQVLEGKAGCCSNAGQQEYAFPVRVRASTAAVGCSCCR